MLFDKLTKEVFDGGEYFEFARVVEEEDDEKKGEEDDEKEGEEKEQHIKIAVIVKDGQHLEPNGDVFLVGVFPFIFLLSSPYPFFLSLLPPLSFFRNLQIDHAWSTTFLTLRHDLLQIPGGLERVANILEFDLTPFSSKEEAVDHLIDNEVFWKAVNHYSVGRADGHEEACVWCRFLRLASHHISLSLLTIFISLSLYLPLLYLLSPLTP